MNAPRTENGDLVKPRLRDKKDIAQGGYIRLVLDFCFGLVIGNHPDPLHWHHIYGHRLINQVSHHSCHQTHPPPQIHKKNGPPRHFRQRAIPRRQGGRRTQRPHKKHAWRCDSTPQTATLTSHRFLLFRCRWIRPAHSSSKCLFKCLKKGQFLLDALSTAIFDTCFSRSLSTASTIVASHFPQQNPSPIKMRPASAPQTSANGIRNSSLLIRRCSLKLFSPPTTSISSHYCKSRVIFPILR